MKKTLAQLAKLVSVRVLALGLTFLQTLVLVRVFKTEIFGALSFALSINALAERGLSLGLDQTLMRDVARSGVENVSRTSQWRKTWAVVRTRLVPLVLLVALGGAATAWLTGGPYKVPMIGAMLTLPVMISRKFIEAVVLGAKAVTRSLVGSQLAYPALMIVGALLVLLLDLDTDDANLTLVYVCAVGGSFTLSAILSRPVVAQLLARQSVATETGHPAGREILRSGMHFALFSMGVILSQHLDVLLVGTMSSPRDVSVVRIASRVAELAGLIRAMATLQYRPLIAEMFGRGDTDRLRSNVSTLAIIFAASGLPITLGLWIFAEEAMQVFGAELTAGAWPLRLYVTGVFFTLLCGPFEVLLVLCDQEHVASRILWITVAMNAALDIALVPTYGALGCAAANMSSLIFMAAASVIAGRRLLGIDTSLQASLRAWQAQAR